MNKNKEISEFLEVGKLYKIYFNKNNPNNMIIWIRSIIDKEVVVFKNIKRSNYIMKDLLYFELILKDKVLTKYNRSMCIECHEKIATYERCTQFAGTHYFCTKCAKKEKDFCEKDSSYFSWRKV
jgi:hypothetical protein